jgi:RNA polymerase sigma factor (sigma-70 family)
VTASLQSLLSATEQQTRDLAWEDFLREYSGALMHAARSLGGDHDAVMDRYLFALDSLRRDDCRRLRGYTERGSGKFSTWLIVVVRRLCLDEYRHRYGRPQGTSVESADRQRERRNLTDLVGNELDLLQLESSPSEAPDAALQRAELRASLDRALAALDPSDRLVLRLRFEDDLSVPRIAQLLGGESPFRMYRRLSRILAAVTDTLKSSGIHDAVP